MATERTFSIIKPDAVAKNVIGPIFGKLEAAGLRVIASPAPSRSNDIDSIASEVGRYA